MEHDDILVGVFYDSFGTSVLATPRVLGMGGMVSTCLKLKDCSNEVNYYKSNYTERKSCRVFGARWRHRRARKT